MRRLFFFLSMLLCSISLVAQEVNSSAGGKGIGAGGVVEYSVGQIFIATSSNSTGAVTQGVQQPYEISVSTGIENTENITLECKVYPNPTADRLVLSVKTDEFRNLKFIVFNSVGNKLQENILDDVETEISLGSYPSSVYILKVFSGVFEIKTFKIIKK